MFFLYDSAMENAALIEDFIDISWSAYFAGAGEMKLTLPESCAAAKSIKMDCFIISDQGEAFVIERVIRGGATVTAECRGVCAMLDRCILPESGNNLPFKTKAAKVIEEAVKKNSTDAFPVRLYVEPCDSEKKLRSRIERGSLYEAVKNTASAAGLGFDITYSEGVFIFKLKEPYYTGTLMWDKAETLYEYSYDTDISDYKNRVTVRGDSDEDGTGALSVTVDAAECGFTDGWDDSLYGIRHGLVEASDIKRSDYTQIISQSGPIVFFDRQSYLEALRGRGAEALVRMRPKISLTVDCIGKNGVPDIKPGEITAVKCSAFKTKEYFMVSSVSCRMNDGEIISTAELEHILL